MTHLAEHFIVGFALDQPRARPRRVGARTPRIRCRDSRWPAVTAALAALRAAKRSSVRIIDADCGAGKMLLCAVRYARLLGFTAIEGRGIDDAPALIARARVAAADVKDPAIGITFETGNAIGALHDENDFPADIVVWHKSRSCDVAVAHAVSAAGRTLISDPAITPGHAR